MIFYQLDYVVEEVLKNAPGKEQLALKKFTGKDFTKKEAEYIWERVIDHKWYIGERLKRDVGERVAAVDYVVNFYDPNTFFKNKRNRTGVFRRIAKTFGQMSRAYFVSKSSIISN